MKSSKSSPLRILDFDLENRPLSYLGMDWTSAEVTSVAWSWVGQKKVDYLLLNKHGRFVTEGGATLSAQKAFAFFRTLLSSADMVTGHYIRKHDLPILNSSLMEFHLPPLSEVLVQDTKCDLVRRKDLSASQENLAALFDLPEPKHHMHQSEWRRANRLTAEGMEATRTRVVADVVQHKALRLELLSRGLLRDPQLWRS